ncbi:Zn-dependent protease [Allonocardiopsis opalescens]|uniref:Zinc metalloprotease n=2 Tax=Allonocardiopsis opalescens TaxID=1144618 RepID=A0A2T0PTY7_9ACTN|nr:site-2 protease family protein [Allonocardiopsis opalescens]PRX92361.1 Zn-dependent protease [Allonocardiopsis opalescens]
MGRWFGIPVYVGLSWFLIAALITYWYGDYIRSLLDIGAWSYLVAFAFAVLLYLSVLVHELAHSVLARHYGLPVRRIVLYMLGGVSEIEREPQTAAREFWVAFVGPLLSLLLAAVGFVLWLVVPQATVPGVLIQQLWVANLLVGVFNLLPGLPLDGGRMLRAGVWGATGSPAAGTRFAAWAGRALGALVLAIPLLLALAYGEMPSLLTFAWAAILGGFIWMASSQSLRVAGLRERLPGLRAGALARRALPVAADLPVSEALRRRTEAGAGALVVCDHEGRPTGVASEAAIDRIPAERRPWVAVSGTARSLEPALMLGRDLAGEELIKAVQAAPAGEYLVVDDDGRVYGVLVKADLDRALAAAARG